MSLRPKERWRKYLPYLVWSCIILLIAGFFLKVFLWEQHYYQHKTGSDRAVTAAENEGVDESEPDRANYKVPASHPRYLSIPKLQVKNARVLQVGLKNNGELNTPSNIFDVGWYFASGLPGQGGTLLLDGHNGGPTKTGVFKQLPSLVKGDIVTIERGDGTIFNYRVVENYTIKLSQADGEMSKMQESPVAGQESLSIITCTGEWSQAQRTYLSRQFLRAVLDQTAK